MLKKFRLENNLSPNVGAWKDILDAYNDEVTDEDVWHIAKESKEVPEIANIYQTRAVKLRPSGRRYKLQIFSFMI